MQLTAGSFCHPPRRKKIFEKSAIPCLISEICGTKIIGCQRLLFLFSQHGVRIMVSTAFLLAASMVVGQAEKANVPDDVIEELGRLVGTWQMTGKEGDETFTAEYTNAWTHEKFAIRLQCMWSGDIEGRGIGFVAWDSVKKEFFGPEAYDDGSVCSLHYKIKSPGVWEGKIRSSLAGKGEYTATIRLEFQSADRYTWVTQEATLNGKPYPDMHLEFKRVK